MIDTEALKNLPDEQKALLVNYEEMFRTKGFSQFIQYVKATAEEKRDRLLFAQNWDQYVHLRAEWAVFEELAGIEELTYKEFEAIADQASEVAIEEIELEYE